MPKLDQEYANAQESSASEYRSIQPGVYMCRIQAVRTEGEDSRGHWTSEQRQYVKLILDIAEGDYANYFSEDYWNGEDKDWGHSLYMSWKSTAYGMLKHTFASLNEANAGFDAQAAFEADKWEMFIGKFILVQWNGQEYESNTGEVRVRVRPDRAVTDSDNVRVKVEKLDGTKVDYSDYASAEAESSTSSEGADLYSDVPF